MPHLLTLTAAAGSKWRAACLTRFQTSSSSIHTLSTGIIKSRIRSPKGFVMIKRKKKTNPTNNYLLNCIQWKADFSSER